jgi:DNA polymerase I
LYGLLYDKDGDLNKNNTDEYNKYISQWINLLNQPIPELKRLAIDIEVEAEEGRIPNPRIMIKNYCYWNGWK